MIIVDLTEWVLQKYLVNAYGVRYGLAGDMSAQSNWCFILIFLNKQNDKGYSLYVR